MVHSQILVTVKSVSAAKWVSYKSFSVVHTHRSAASSSAKGHNPKLVPELVE